MSTESTPNAAATSLVGQVISGRYRIERLLGEGGMGAVFLAEHTHMRKRVALKLLHAEMSSDEEVLARFKREAEAAAHVEHPNVAAATDFGQTTDGSFFLVLEYVEGTSLRDALAKGHMAPHRALHIARQIAFALERAHGAGIVHRDLKPENVMLVQKGDDPDFVKVLDFGIAKVEPHHQRDATQPLTRLGTILGTPEYMAPEQALGEVVGPGADLYAVGVMLFEMLTGKHPFDAHDRMAVLSMHIVAPVPKMSDRNPAVDVAPPVEDLVRSLLEKDAKQRPPSARALVDAIDVAAAQAGVPLPHLASSRSLVARESSPDFSRSPKPPSSEARPSREWRSDDALAKTDYGLPTPNLPTMTGERSLPFRLPPFLAPLEKLPRNVLLGAAVGLPMFVFAFIVVLIVARGGKRADGELGDAGARPNGGEHHLFGRETRASAEEIKAASAQGPEALEKLAAKFPEDASVQAELARSFSASGRTAEMLGAMRKLARLDKNAVDDKLMDAVEAAAQRPESSEDAFELLEGALGARGVDSLLEMSTNKSTPLATQRRAAKSLARADVREHASAAAGVVIDLKGAKKCEDKHELLGAAQESGDARVLPTLKAMKNPRGCGFMGMRDCYSCMRKDDALEDALKAVEARSSK